MEMLVNTELVGVIRERYVCANKKDKSRILDELVAVTGHHRKHAVMLLSEPNDVTTAESFFDGSSARSDVEPANATNATIKE